MDDPKIPHYVKPFLGRIRGGATLVSQVSQSEEATEKGDGHIYFTHPDGRPVGTASAIYCIRNGLVIPEGDDLFGGSQTYRAA
jgi:hypothetical protein